MINSRRILFLFYYKYWSRVFGGNLKKSLSKNIACFILWFLKSCHVFIYFSWFKLPFYCFCPFLDDFFTSLFTLLVNQTPIVKFIILLQNPRNSQFYYYFYFGFGIITIITKRKHIEETWMKESSCWNGLIRRDFYSNITFLEQG